MGKRFGRRPVPPDSLVIAAIVSVAVSFRIWQLAFAYRRSIERLRARRRARLEHDLFARLERSMQSDRVE